MMTICCGVLHQTLTSVSHLQKLNSAMRRKAISLGFVCLILGCLVGLRRLMVIRSGSSGRRPEGQYIFRGPHAEHKAIVMAQITGENVDWVREELQE